MAISDTVTRLLRGRIKLRHLHLVLILEEERSISRAAERLCISQAAVSKTRAEIEAGIGAPLFTRVKNRLELTEAGECVLQSARRIVAELQNLGDEIAVMGSGMRGTVTLGMRSVSAEPFVAYVATKFKDTHPTVTVRMIDSDLPDLLERLAKGEVTLVVGRIDSEHVPEHLESQILLADHNVVIASRGHPLVGKADVGWDELIRHRWCLSPTGYAGRFSRDHLLTHLRTLNLPLPVDLIEPTSFNMHVTLLQAGSFITLVPEGVGHELEQAELARRIDVAPIGTADPVCLMWRSDMPQSPASKRFRDFMIKMTRTEAGAQMLGTRPSGQIAARRFGMLRQAAEGDAAPPSRPARRSGRLSSA